MVDDPMSASGRPSGLGRAVGLLLAALVASALLGGLWIWGVDALFSRPFVRDPDLRHAMACAGVKAPRPADCRISLSDGQDRPLIAPGLEAFTRHRSERWSAWLAANPGRALPDALPGDPEARFDPIGSTLWLLAHARAEGEVLDGPASLALKTDEAPLKPDIEHYRRAAQAYWDAEAAPGHKDFMRQRRAWQASQPLRFALMAGGPALLGLGLLGLLFPIPRRGVPFRLSVERAHLGFGRRRIPWADVRELARVQDRLVVYRHTGAPLRSPPLEDPLAFDALIERAGEFAVGGVSVGTPRVHTSFTIEGATLVHARPIHVGLHVLLGLTTVGLALASAALFFAVVPPPAVPAGLDCAAQDHPVCEDMPQTVAGLPSVEQLIARRRVQWRRAYAAYGDAAPSRVTFPVGPEFNVQRDELGQLQGILKPGPRPWLVRLAQERDWFRDPGVHPPLQDYEDAINARIADEVSHLRRSVNRMAIQQWELRLFDARLARTASLSTQLAFRVAAIALPLGGLLLLLLFLRSRRTRIISLSHRGITFDGRLLPWAEIVDVRLERSRVTVQTSDGNLLSSRFLPDPQVGHAFVQAARPHLLGPLEVLEETEAAVVSAQVLAHINARDAAR